MYFPNELNLALAKNKYPVAKLIMVLEELFSLANNKEDTTIRLAERNFTEYQIEISDIPDMYQLGTDFCHQSVAAHLQNLKSFINLYNYDNSWEEPIIKVLTTHDLNCASINVCECRLAGILCHMIDVA